MSSRSFPAVSLEQARALLTSPGSPLEIEEREALRVKLFMEQINQSEKTLVFCATQHHALAVRDLVNQMKTSKDPNYCHRVTADDGALGEQHLRDFQITKRVSPAS